MQSVIEAMDYEIAVFATWDDPGGHHASEHLPHGGDRPTRASPTSDMKVFGTDNLYVCSNAAFPSCTAVNPTLTLTAMSMRLGDHLICEAADG